MEEFTLTLKSPIEFGNSTIEELTFKEVTALEMRGIKPGMSMGELLDIAGKLSGQPKSVINRLKAEDANAVVEYVGNALGGGV
ncbi:MAG: phage tail assembly protein [Pseudobacteriovorax sp.]|nr:phage tail assembly protein [Pseudobacteriovorax sp.]NRA68621.1 phage tail assembly protein [Pseudobacteriovorax sp.]